LLRASQCTRCLAGQLLRIATATAMTDCMLARIEKARRLDVFPASGTGVLRRIIIQAFRVEYTGSRNETLE